jgi:hypothetical protein
MDESKDSMFALESIALLTPCTMKRYQAGGFAMHRLLPDLVALVLFLCF